MNTISLSRPIGDRPLSLIPHLRATIDLLLDQGLSGYCWTSNYSCNAGLLARCVLGYTREQLKSALQQQTCDGGWERIISEACPHNPDARWPQIVQQLLDAGLDSGDPVHLEALSHPMLMDPSWIRGFCALSMKANKSEEAYCDPACVAAYLLRWVKAIEAHHAALADEPAAAVAEVTHDAALVAGGVS